MISDILFEAQQGIRRYQSEVPGMYASARLRLDELRAHMNAVMMELEAPFPDQLAGNPIYEACKRGDVSLSDRYIDGDDSVLDEWRRQISGLGPLDRED